MAETSDDEYDIPLRDQRYFGAGIKRKRIHFVPSTSVDTADGSKPPTTPNTSTADRYLAIVLGQTAATTERPASENPRADPESVSDTRVTHAEDLELEADSEIIAVPRICAICSRVVEDLQKASTHESSITHQICLQHSHPPSHVDRGRKGLAVLQSHGWDPDSRLGLGAEGEGMLHPVKAKENKQRAGLGAKLGELEPKKKVVKLNAREVRAMENESRKRRDLLRDAFFRSEDYNKYLGS